MYKMHNRKIDKIFKIFMISWLIDVFLVWKSFSWEWVPLDSFKEFVDMTESQVEINSMKWKAVVENIYDEALKSIESSYILPSFESLSTITDELNKEYSCSLEKTDILNILYIANKEFKRNTKLTFSNVKYPSKSDMRKSCDKLWYCKNKTKTLNPETYSECQRKVNTMFVNDYSSSYSIANLSAENKWSDAFWNNSLDDSSYDILNDVYVLWKIMFEEVEEPAELLFYHIPKARLTSPILPENRIEINRFSPYNTYHIIESSWNEENNINSWIISWSQSVVDGGEEILYSDDTWLVEFIEHVNIAWSDWESFLWNDCIDDFEIPWYSGESYDIVTYWWYETYVQDIMNWISCNNDWFCDPFETSSCPDCQSSLSWWSWNNSWTVTDIEEILNYINWIGDDIEDSNYFSCFSNCENISWKNSAEKLTCYAKCLCLTYESPIFDPAVHPGMSPMFKLKFCVIPVADSEVTSNKKVYSLSAVITELYNVVKWLRNSWNLMLSKKTKEFLDAWFQNNDFSKQLSFSIDSYQKSVFENESEKALLDKQMELNTSLMESILWFSRQSSDKYESNKYMIVWPESPCDTWVSPDNSDNSGVFDSEVDEWVLVVGLQTDKLWKITRDIEDFLQSNLNFWMSVNESLSWFNDISKLMFQKK